MENYPSEILKQAVEAISSLPGVGSRSALRLALHLLRQPSDNIHNFTGALNRLADEIKYCSCCGMVCDGDLCPVCSDSGRDRSTVCVIESVRDYLSIEATGQYRGVYHILGGIISPINGIAPSDLRIRELVERVASGNVGEVILALSGDVEGETTSFYIYRQLERFKVKVSTLARGLAFGDDLEYADPLTLGRSIQNRQIFKP